MGRADIKALQALFKVWKGILDEVEEVVDIKTGRRGDYLMFDVVANRCINVEGNRYITFAINMNTGRTQLHEEVARFASRCFIYFGKVLPTL